MVSIKWCEKLNRKIKSSGERQVVRYFAYFDARTLLGVTKKVTQTVAALNNLGYEAQSVIVSERGLNVHGRMFMNLLTAKTDVLMLRNTLYSMPLLAFALLWQRCKGTRIIIEIPTPNTVALHEVRMLRDKGVIGRWVRLAIMAIAFPWSLYPAHKIIQYAHESTYFSFGVRRKTQLHANGIDVSSIPERKAEPAWPAKEFVMIGVASLAPWHAFDRVIRGIVDYRDQHPESGVTPRLIVVGDGEVRAEWERLAQTLGVTDCVEFVGYQSGTALDALFERAHVAIASLGLFRIGLEMASVLKSREYTARGIPFIAAGYDLDFDPVPEFVFRVVNEDWAVDVGGVMGWYGRNCSDLLPGSKIREFAERSLDYSRKVKHAIE